MEPKLVVDFLIAESQLYRYDFSVQKKHLLTNKKNF